MNDKDSHSDSDTHFGFEQVPAAKKAERVRGVFDAVAEEVEYITPKIKELMTSALLLPRGVPLEGEVGSGRNWLQAH